MTRFEDGPAKGAVLQLRRAPLFLRVVEANGQFDALDQLEDSPKALEKLYAYVLTAKPGWCHIRASKGGGFYPMANYRLVAVQPPEKDMRDNDDWTRWCHLPENAAHLRVLPD